MVAERRTHQRVKPKNLKADIFINEDGSPEVALDADIIDISVSGIRVKLKQPINSIKSHKIKVTMMLPDSKVPFSVHGILKHQHADSEAGIHYTDRIQGSVDNFIFDCISLNNKTMLIKTS